MADSSGLRTADFDALFDAYKDYVYSVAFHLCRDRDAAEDITQVVFIKLWRNTSPFRGESEFRTWLYRVVTNSFLDHRRRNRKWIFQDPPADEAASGFTPHQALEQQEAAESVRKALGTLSPNLRLPLVLRYIAGLSYEEIAVVLGTTRGTVASSINRGHARLARKLSHLKNAGSR